MSSILKALRKIEEEKRAVSHVAPDLRSDQGSPAKKQKLWPPLLAGISLGSLVVAVLFMLVGNDGQHEVTSKPVVVQTPAVKVVATKAAISEEVPVVRMPAEPVAVEPVKTIPLPVSKKTGAKVPPAIVAPAPEPTKTLSPTKTAPEPVVAVTQASRPLPDGVSLQVSEIFFQENPQDSMAVVNELPVMIGTHIESAVVLEILYDRVVFDIDGLSYPVKIFTP